MANIHKVTKEEFETMQFRVECVLCHHGTGMTISEINVSLLRKGQPYIVIPYCKYCYTDDAIGLFCDEPECLGWGIDTPSESDSGEFDWYEIPRQMSPEEARCFTNGRTHQEYTVYKGKL